MPNERAVRTLVTPLSSTLLKAKCKISQGDIEASRITPLITSVPASPAGHTPPLIQVYHSVLNMGSCWNGLSVAVVHAHLMLLVPIIPMGILVNAIQIILVMDILMELDASQLILGFCIIHQLSMTKRTIQTKRLRRLRLRTRKGLAY